MRPPAPFLHAGHDGAAQHEGRRDVDLLDAGEVVGRDLGKIADLGGAGVVDQDLDAHTGGLFGEGRRCLGVGEIDGAVFAAGGRLAARFSAGANDAGAVAQQALGYGAAEAAGGAGYQRQSSIKGFGHFSPPRCSTRNR